MEKTEKLNSLLRDMSKLIDKIGISKSACEVAQAQLQHALIANLSDEEIEKCRQNCSANFEVALDLAIEMGRLTRQLRALE